MALSIPVLGTQRWIFPDDPAIDTAAMDDYTLRVGHDYEPPPIREGETPAYIEIRQLSDAAFSRAQALQAQAGGDLLSPEFVEHVIRHGVVGWGGLYRGTDPLPPPEYDPRDRSPWGQRLTAESYESILPFLGAHAATLAVHLYMLSLPPIS